ncbi:phage protease [Falsiroseomonas sp.]|uniref:phage protease n=1 Tax=Falsiroseomonas sp. TaxID=2870721 RepID=UPI003F6F17E8
MLTAILHSALPYSGGAAAGQGAAPVWVQLVPAGTFRGGDGRGPYTLTDPAAVIAESMARGPLPFDENHATDLAMTTGIPSPARGWIVAMEAREDGIWGRVEWTPEGQALLASRAYRGISPVIAVTKTGGQIMRVLRAALTNTPNLPQLATLHTQTPKETQVDLTALRRALGLAEDADDAAILAAAQAAQTAVAAHGQQMATLATAAGLGAGAPPTAIVTALQTRLAAGDPGKMAQDLVALQTQLATLQQSNARVAAEATVDGAIRAGKPIPASLRDHYITRHMADPVAVAKELDGLPSLHAGGLTGRTPPATGKGTEGLGAEDKQVIALLGISPEAFVKARAAEGVMVGSA